MTTRPFKERRLLRIKTDFNGRSRRGTTARSVLGAPGHQVRAALSLSANFLRSHTNTNPVLISSLMAAHGSTALAAGNVISWESWTSTTLSSEALQRNLPNLSQTIMAGERGPKETEERMTTTDLGIESLTLKNIVRLADLVSLTEPNEYPDSPRRQPKKRDQKTMNNSTQPVD